MDRSGRLDGEDGGNGVGFQGRPGFVCQSGQSQNRITNAGREQRDADASKRSAGCACRIRIAKTSGWRKWQGAVGVGTLSSTTTMVGLQPGQFDPPTEASFLATNKNP